MADNLTAIREPIVDKIWEPRRLTTLWAFMACYEIALPFLFLMYQDEGTDIHVPLCKILSATFRVVGV
jgi:hypothetical protein